MAASAGLDGRHRSRRGVLNRVDAISVERLAVGTHSIRDNVDALMRALHAAAPGALHQTLVADFSIADAYRCLISGTPMPYRRPLLGLTDAVWRVSKALFGIRTGIRVAAIAASIIALPRVFHESLRLHEQSYGWEGDKAARIILLRTAVANEPRIAKWLEEGHGAPVAMLTRNLSAPLRLKGALRVLQIAGRHFRLNAHTAKAIAEDGVRAAAGGAYVKLMPYWLALMARESVEIVWAQMWAETFLAPRAPSHFYFTMNYAFENGFRHGLPGVPCAYVEHGFPRRDIPPLGCRQYVYSEGYAAYLRSFGDGTETEIIGLDYFPKEDIQPTRTIVIASLQDWAGFKIASVEAIFNRALTDARENGWRIVFRTRSYGNDAFVNTLHGPWDEISEASDETFSQCLVRSRPAMVWTTWSTAVLDAAACGVEGVAFVTRELDHHFVTDLDQFALCVLDDGTNYPELAARLARAD